MEAACRRYLDFVSALEDSSAGSGELDKITHTARDKNGRGFGGFNLFRASDQQAILAVRRGGHQISGLTRRGLARLLPGWSGARLSLLLITGLKLKESLSIPTFRPQP